MGSTFLTLKEAAEFLKRSERTIHNYVSAHLLRTHREGGRTYVLREDVEMVKGSLGGPMPHVSRKSIWTLTKRIEALELRVQEALVRYGGDLESRLRPNSEVCQIMVAQAKATVSQSEWPLEEFQLWATNLVTFDYVTLERFEAELKLPKPWEPFLAVCDKLLNALELNPATKKDIHLQSIRHQLLIGQRRLRSAIAVWYELGKLTMPGEAPRPETPKEALLRRKREAQAAKV